MSPKQKTVFLSLSLFLIITIIVSTFLTSQSFAQTLQDKTTKPTIVIDPGHGGEDGGASANGIVEKELNLIISQKLSDLLKLNGFDVKMIRNSDTAIYDKSETSHKKRSDLNNRVRIFNDSKLNIVISIHQNIFMDSKYYGTQIFYSKNDEKSKLLAESIRTSTVNLLQKDNTRKCKKAGNEIFLLDKAEVPAVLIECGFISNKQEAEKLADSNYQNELVYCIYLGILEYYYTNY